MILNDPYAAPRVQAPRVRLLAGGTPVTGCLSMEVCTGTHFKADTLEAQFALNADPSTGVAFWGRQSSLDVVAQISFDGDSWQSLITAQVDDIDIHMEHAVCSITGRDLSARLIDARTQEAFQNQTSSQVAQILAARHGLTADVQATNTLVGRYYSQDHDHITGNQFTRTRSEWDILVYLAQREQLDVWVTDTTLHFKPGAQPGQDAWLAAWQSNPNTANVESLELRRSLTLAPDVVVKVRSWNSRHARGFTKSSPSGLAATSAVSTGRAQQFVYVFPNMTEQEAQQKADALREDITRHERLVSFRAPGDLLLTRETLVRLKGTGSSWDQDYYVDRITRSISFEQGFFMDVRCKNHSPESEATP